MQPHAAHELSMSRRGPRAPPCALAATHHSPLRRALRPPPRPRRSSGSAWSAWWCARSSSRHRPYSPTISAAAAARNDSLRRRARIIVTPTIPAVSARSITPSTIPTPSLVTAVMTSAAISERRTSIRGHQGPYAFGGWTSSGFCISRATLSPQELSAIASFPLWGCMVLRSAAELAYSAASISSSASNVTARIEERFLLILDRAVATINAESFGSSTCQAARSTLSGGAIRTTVKLTTCFAASC